MNNIFVKDKNGELISFSNPDITKITDEIKKTQKKIKILNKTINTKNK